MIIEVHTNIDSRFILYDMVNVISRMGTVKWITANTNVADFDYENNIDILHVDSNYFEEEDKNVEDYIIYDNLIAATPNSVIHFIDPYSELDITQIGKDDKIIRVMQGINKKHKKNSKLKDQLLDEEELFKEELLKKPCLKKLQSYENIFRFEKLKCDLSTTKEFINILILLGLAKPANMKRGGKREHSNEKLHTVLW